MKGLNLQDFIEIFLENRLELRQKFMIKIVNLLKRFLIKFKKQMFKKFKKMSI